MELFPADELRPRGRNQKPQSLIHDGPMHSAEFKAYKKAYDRERKRTAKRREQYARAVGKVSKGKLIVVNSKTTAEDEIAVIEQARLQHMLLPHKQSW